MPASASGLPEEVPASDRSQDPPRNLVDQLPAILYVAEPGPQGRWLYVSRGVQEILGFSAEEWMADPELWARQMHPEDRERIFDHEAQLDSRESPTNTGCTTATGAPSGFATKRPSSPTLRGPAGTGDLRHLRSQACRSRTQRRAEQQAAVARLGKYALEGADFATLTRQALAEATRITGARAGAVLEQDRDAGSLTVRGMTGLSRGRDARAREPRGPARRPPRADSEPDGRWGVLWLAGMPGPTRCGADGDFVQALANILADALQRRATEDAIRYQAVHDHLTGLPNRVLFLDRLASALARPEANVAVVMLDIDNFKLVNDSLGHAAGDELLTQIAPRLKAALRPRDTIARLGGDEFVVLLEQVGDERSAAQVAERIVAAFGPPFQLDAGEHFAKTSLGIAMAEASGSTPAGLLRDADAALYQAKAGGRARYAIFDHAMRTRIVERLSIQNDLRRALERDELHVVYQPIVSLARGRSSPSRPCCAGSTRSVGRSARWSSFPWPRKPA